MAFVTFEHLATSSTIVRIMARSSEGQMDFQYDNKTGPVGDDSPWTSFTKSQPWQQADSVAKKRARSPNDRPEEDLRLILSNPGPFSAFESPNKPSTFSIRAPSSDQSFLFSSPSLSRLPPQITSPSFTTPRKSQPECPSSGAETSPDNNADSEATPDSSRAVVLKKSGDALAMVFKGSPGRGEISRGPYSNAIRNRINKRRKANPGRQVGQHRRSDSSASHTDNETEATTKPTKPYGAPKTAKDGVATSQGKAPGAVAAFVDFIDAHPGLPHTLSFYAQLLLNVFLVLFVIFLVYSFWATVRADVDKKAEEAMAELVAEMAVCTRDYRENGCAGERRAPALDGVCDSWERCMTRDPRRVGRARVSAHTFAEIFNSFIEPISVKAMVSPRPLHTHFHRPQEISR